MLIIWLIVWLLNETPAVQFAGGDLNNWAIALIICVVVDLFGTRRAL